MLSEQCLRIATTQMLPAAVVRSPQVANPTHHGWESRMVRALRCQVATGGEPYTLWVGVEDGEGFAAHFVDGGRGDFFFLRR